MDPVLKRLTELRINLLNEFPFFGRLLYKITFGLDDCGTAYTDMRHIVFDPKFASRISDVELRTVLMHEILHCALKHCTRSAGKDRFKYNIACDIVVNSYILEITGMEEIEIDGEEIMHLAPNGKEGHLHTAEEIYFMLMKMKSEDIVKMYGGEDYIKNHKAWGEIDHENMDGEWDKNIRDVALSIGEGSGIPDCLTRYIREVEHSPRT
ncbi:MAG: hypothetical protein J6V50_02450, partial [Clostridia bacterium]|nr:hypothetical protein [Clostridia bacterium]